MNIGRGIGTETCVYGDMFLPNVLTFSPDTKIGSITLHTDGLVQ